MRDKKVRMKRKALSLVEITLSMAILIIVMLPSFLAFSSGNRGIQMTDAEFRAHSAAIELMEQTISLPFDMIKAGLYEKESIVDGGKFGDTQAVFHLSFSSEYQPQILVEDIVRDSKVIFKKITVTINYPMTKGSGTRRDFSVKVIINNDTI